MTATDTNITRPSVGPWTHFMKQTGLYELRFEGRAIGEFMFTRPPNMAAVLVRDMVAGLNAGHAVRHPDVADSIRGVGDDRIVLPGASLAAGDGSVPPADPAVSSPTPDTSDRTPAQFGEPINTPAEAEAWIATHRRNYQNGRGIADRAYFDEIDGRPDIDGRAVA